MKVIAVFLLVVNFLQAALLYRTVTEKSPLQQIMVSSNQQPTSTHIQQLKPKIAKNTFFEDSAAEKAVDKAISQHTPPAMVQVPDVADFKREADVEPVLPMADRFAAQDRDDNWYATAENELLDAVSALNSDNYWIYETDCRQSLCRMEIGLDDVTSTTNEELSSLVPWPAYTRIKIDADVVPARATLYVAREGFDFYGTAHVEDEIEDED